MPLNHTLCAMFMFNGFIQARGAIVEKDDDAHVRIDSNVAGGGEIECAAWISDVAEDVVKACSDTLMKIDAPGVWLHGIAEDVGAKIANDANESDVYSDDIVKHAIELSVDGIYF